ncbi:hypothetical protein Y032_0286g1391 [Ancylostoma ceylanicum]|uniref:C-type lectin domain-containing protein n=1 Tax=Ancylostoma ceylanicum TaxID=53326 RepID=A0A016S747_9BILA|nr:hypothetical protein Y032_0286g1391 [Ancylostoma ceylanicum]
MTLFVSLERTERIGPPWHVKETNGRIAGARSVYPTISGSQDGSQQPPEPVSDWKFFRETSMCYRAYKDGGNFDESRSWCKKENGELASIHTTEHNEFLTGLTRGKIDGSVLIGLRLGDVNGIVTKEWTDGSEYNYERWAPRKPSSSGHCTILIGGRFLMATYPPTTYTEDFVM